MSLEIVPDKNPKYCPVKYCRNPRSRRGRGIRSKCSMRDWRAKNPLRAAFAHLKYSALSRRKPFLLTFEQFREFAEREHYLETAGSHGWETHIDRIDPARGYEIDNIQILTCSENTAKGNRERYAVAAYSGGGEGQDNNPF